MRIWAEKMPKETVGKKTKMTSGYVFPAHSMCSSGITCDLKDFIRTTVFCENGILLIQETEPEIGR